MSSNTLATHGNERTMNLNSVIFQNIIDSPYLKTIAELETFHEVQTEAQRNVKSMGQEQERLTPARQKMRLRQPSTKENFRHDKRTREGALIDRLKPFLKGTTPSTAWVLMYKFWTLRLTVRQIESLIDNVHSVYLRGLGFLYLRFVCKPDQLWDWMGDYLEDDQEITLQAGPKPVYSTIGKMCYMLLHDQKFQGQMLPRIPVLVMRDLEQKLEPFADAGRAKTGQRDHFKKDRDNRGRDGGRGRERDRDSSSSRYDRRRSRSRSRSRGRDRGGRRYDDDDREGHRSRRYNDSRSRSRDRWGNRRRDDYRRRSRSRSRSRSPGRR